MTELARLVPIRLTAAEWERIGDDEHRYELVEGILQMVPPESPRNTAAAEDLAWLLGTAARAGTGGRGFRVLGATQVDTSPAGSAHPTYRVSDLAVVATTTPLGGPIAPSDLLLVVEIVSPTSERVDYLHKRAEYAEAGVPAYLIVDVRPGRERLLYLVSSGSEGSYQVAGDGTSVVLALAGVDVPVDVADLLW